MAFADELREVAQALKSRVDLHDLAARLGLERPQPNGNYKSPHHEDKMPSLSIFEKNGAQGWKDHSANEGGDCISLVRYVQGGDPVEAMKLLCEWYSVPWPAPAVQQPAAYVEKSRAEFIAEKCLASPKRAMEYLCGERKIHESVVARAIKSGAVGFNDWTSPKVPEGEPGYGGPAAAFICRSLNPGKVMAVELRYLTPALNGGVKTQTQGEKAGYGWTSDLRRLMSAKTIYVVESPINALSIECAGIPHTAAFALRGVANVDDIDWPLICRGKQVFIACDHTDAPMPDTLKDGKPNPRAGIRPGLEAAWRLHERLTSLDISAMLVDMGEWDEGCDVNDYLKEHGAEELRRALQRIEHWLIPGLSGSSGEQGDLFGKAGKRRLWLPYHHDFKYWRYRVRPEFTSVITKVENDADGAPKIDMKDLAGFRVASISRVTIQSATATMTGDLDSQPRVMFAITAQTARHGANLLRRVVDDEKLHNIETWKRIGPVFDQSSFLRMVNILENAAHIGERKAANFVGLCWQEGRLKVNEGPDCYFMNPEQQCPYHSLTFPSGSRADARRVVEAYAQTFGRAQALMLLTWSLGGHLKTLLGFWPHLQMQADKGSGKSTLIKRLERSIAFTMFSGQSLNTEFRQLTSISHTSHPVGWEEISARDQRVIDRAVGMLQENYQYTVNRRGAELTEFLLSAPVLLAGEDVPVDSLIGKLVRINLSAADRGPLMADDLPRFPVKQWLGFLAECAPEQVRKVYAELREGCAKESRASGEDTGAARLAGNYAALLTAWRFLAEFAGLDPKAFEMTQHVVHTMNGHIKDTSGDRHPWVWIVQTLLSEIAAGAFEAPYKFDFQEVEGEEVQQLCLFVRTSDVMHHLKTRPALRDIWNALPVKSDRVFKRQLEQAGVIAGEGEKTINSRRVAHMPALWLKRLETFGLHAVVPKDVGSD